MVFVLDRWQNKILYFRKLARDWSANFHAEIRKHKKRLMEEYDVTDVKELSHEKIIILLDIYRELSSYWLIEEIKASQRSRYI